MNGTNITANVTGRFFDDNPAINALLRDTNKHKPLTDDEEQKVFQIYKEIRDKSATERISPEEEKIMQNAKDRLILSNTKMIFALAKKMAHNNNSDLNELTMEGFMGLMYALDKYDPEMNPGVRFTTYGMPWARKYMFNFINKNKDERISDGEGIKPFNDLDAETSDGRNHTIKRHGDLEWVDESRKMTLKTLTEMCTKEIKRALMENRRR